jgi:DNA-binding response OmpR family regulator
VPGLGPVLLVEDDAEIRELIEDAFQDRGLAVACADSDQAAFAILEAQAANIKLLVADINLGQGADGFDVARRARRLNPDLKVIYITGHAAQFGKYGVEDGEIFPKPFNPGQLADRVIAAIGR